MMDHRTVPLASLFPPLAIWSRILLKDVLLPDWIGISWSGHKDLRIVYEK